MKHNVASSLFAASALVALAFSYGCSSSSSSSSGAKPGTTGPVVDASKLGGECSGGTSPGDSVAFNDNTCAAGVCIADATGGSLDNFQTYCSADCSNAQCPSGYVCKATTIGGTNDCFIDPNSTANDAGSSSSGSGGGGSTGGACVTLSGTYSIDATQASTNSTDECTDIPSGTTASFDQSDAGTGCTQTFDAASCTYTNFCTSDDGEGNTSKLTMVINTNTLKGSFDLVSSSTGTDPVECDYTVTLAK
jgi:hypothetical protein